MRWWPNLQHLARQAFAPGAWLRFRYARFKRLLDADTRAMERIADLQDAFHGVRPLDQARIRKLVLELCEAVEEMAHSLQAMRPLRYQALNPRLEAVRRDVEGLLAVETGDDGPPYAVTLEEAAGRPDLAGGKAANLGRVARETGLNVPPGMVVTANAWRLFLRETGLRERLDQALAETLPCRQEDFARRCRAMQDMVADAEPPQEVAEAVRKAVETLAEQWDAPDGDILFAVRSSAWAEDGGDTFAGQYDSLLNVPAGEAVAACLQVAASKYSQRAVAYRILHGLSDHETPMAVLILPMVPARAAGVAYSLDPDVEEPGGGVSVHATAGLGEALVQGDVEAEVHHVSRERPHDVFSPPAPDAARADLVRRTAGLAMELERLFGRPQDVEWAQDGHGRLWVLQSRGFRAEPSLAPPAESPAPAPLIRDLAPAAAGAASGRILHLHDAQGPVHAPPGSVVVTETLSPNLTRCLDTVEAVIGMSGGRAGHFATVAREFGVPVVVADPAAAASLEDGQEVTVDAYGGCVYPGRLDDLVQATEQARRQVRSQFRQRLAPLVPLVSELNLVDPDGPEFSPQGCRSLHDMIRYIHEMGVREMFDLVGKSGRGMAGSRRLATELPLTMYVLSLDSDVAWGRGSDVALEDVPCEPLQAVWRGLASEPELWRQAPPPADWEEMDRFSAGIFGRQARFLSSYAIAARDYLHMLIRFGYHFSVLDSVCGPRDGANHVSFRFRGGGAEFDARLLRLRFIERILTAFGFQSEVKGDMLEARYARGGAEATLRRLGVLGRVMARTRLMDIRIRDADDVETLAEAFLRAEQG